MNTAYFLSVDNFLPLEINYLDSVIESRPASAIKDVVSAIVFIVPNPQAKTSVKLLINSLVGL